MSQLGLLRTLAHRLPSFSLYPIQIVSNPHDLPGRPLAEFAPQTDKSPIAGGGLEVPRTSSTKIARPEKRPRARRPPTTLYLVQKDGRARILCQAHAIWPLIKARASAGRRISPRKSQWAVNRAIRSVLAKLGYRDGQKPLPHAARRGASHGIENIGPTISLVIQ